ncbi:hypothetical protein TYRP_008985 [Tyrophagus putrescentiae]|nr:hypothetical protein TYRP_008985 [Tyrophagus putrescentiae]
MSGELGSLENRFDRAGNGALAPVPNVQAEAPAPPIRARSARIQERVERMRAAAAAQDPQAPAAVQVPVRAVRARAPAAPAARILAALDEVVWALAPRTRRWWPAVVVDPHEFRRDSPSIRRYVRQQGAPPARLAPGAVRRRPGPDRLGAPSDAALLRERRGAPQVRPAWKADQKWPPLPELPSAGRVCTGRAGGG